MAAGAVVRLGPRASGHDPDESGVSVAVLTSATNARIWRWPHGAGKPVEAVIDELNHLDRTHGPLGSVVIHDSMFFQDRAWLTEWLEQYPRRARTPWPYWAAARSDMVRRWPDLFEGLLRETRWTTVSIGFESGSDAVLAILNKECTADDHRFAIELVNRIGDDLAARGREPPRLWANLILGVPGETREDAFKTMRMLRSMKRALPSIASSSPRIRARYWATG